MHRLKVRDSWMEYRAVLESFEDFSAGPNFYGRRVVRCGGRWLGNLAPYINSWGGLYDYAVYVVWSYSTPIAFAVPLYGDPDDLYWFVPAVRHSKTTTRHQNKVRVALRERYMEREVASPIVPYNYTVFSTSRELAKIEFWYSGTMMVHVEKYFTDRNMPEVHHIELEPHWPTPTWHEFHTVCEEYINRMG